MGIYLPGSLFSSIFLLYSCGSLSGVPLEPWYMWVAVEECNLIQVSIIWVYRV